MRIRRFTESDATALTRDLLHKATVLGKQAVIECDPKQEITKTIAIHAGFDYIGIKDGFTRNSGSEYALMMMPVPEWING